MTLLAVIAGAAALAVISWLDDLRGLSPAVRLGAQCAAVALGIVTALPEGAVFQGWLPAALDMAAAALLWVWFVNLYNFMDGIDGIAGSETAAIGIGLALFAVAGIGDDPALAASRRRNRRRRDRVPGVELGAGAHLSRRCRQRAARLSARLSAARRRGARTLEDRADPAAVFPGRRDDHTAAPPRCAASASGCRIASISISRPCGAASAMPPSCGG